MPAESNLAPVPTAATDRTDGVPLIAHIIYRLDVGGLENGLVNLINRIPAEQYRHAIICLTDYSEFRRRIERADIPVYCLHKPPGNSPITQFRLWRLLRQLRPDIVHTRNLAALECTLAAALARRAVRIHGEHGRDLDDLDGSNVGRQRLRRLFKPFVHQYVAVSKDLWSYLHDKVGVPASRVAQIYNGVDIKVFHPALNGREPLASSRFERGDLFVIGNVGRMQAVKDPLNLVKAFILLLQMLPGARKRLRLAMAGDGPLRRDALDLLTKAGALDATWLPGNRNDIPSVMRGFDLFVLPSLAEGISNTLLEAMASGLPVVATRVGGNPELVEEGTTAKLVPPAEPEALAHAIREYVLDPEMAKRHSSAARRRAEQRFDLDVMVKNYIELYDRASASHRHSRSGAFAGRKTTEVPDKHLLPLDGEGQGRG
jgi:sugar transferase (PEP-CTERM/EpsH1 system associated)